MLYRVNMSSHYSIIENRPLWTQEIASILHVEMNDSATPIVCID